jgi:hypothetical protein
MFKKNFAFSVESMEKYFSREFHVSSSNECLEILQHTVGDVSVINKELVFTPNYYFNLLSPLFQTRLAV